jgi:hypothetical protein
MRIFLIPKQKMTTIHELIQNIREIKPTRKTFKRLAVGALTIGLLACCGDGSPRATASQIPIEGPKATPVLVEPTPLPVEFLGEPTKDGKGGDALTTKTPEPYLTTGELLPIIGGQVSSRDGLTAEQNTLGHELSTQFKKTNPNLFGETKYIAGYNFFNDMPVIYLVGEMNQKYQGIDVSQKTIGIVFNNETIIFPFQILGTESSPIKNLNEVSFQLNKESGNPEIIKNNESGDLETFLKYVKGSWQPGVDLGLPVTGGEIAATITPPPGDPIPTPVPPTQEATLKEIIKTPEEAEAAIANAPRPPYSEQELIAMGYSPEFQWVLKSDGSRDLKASFEKYVTTVDVKQPDGSIAKKYQFRSGFLEIHTDTSYSTHQNFIGLVENKKLIFPSGQKGWLVFPNWQRTNSLETLNAVAAQTLGNIAGISSLDDLKTLLNSTRDPLLYDFNRADGTSLGQVDLKKPIIFEIFAENQKGVFPRNETCDAESCVEIKFDNKYAGQVLRISVNDQNQLKISCAETDFNLTSLPYNFGDNLLRTTTSFFSVRQFRQLVNNWPKISDSEGRKLLDQTNIGIMYNPYFDLVQGYEVKRTNDPLFPKDQNLTNYGPLSNINPDPKFMENLNPASLNYIYK